MLNSVIAVILIVLMGISAFAISISAYYYSGVRTSLETKAKTATDFFANYITKTYAEYYQSAYRYAEMFEERDNVELQFVSTRGKVLVSTYGVAAGDRPGTSDIDDAIETRSISVWTGRNPGTGERIMAVSSPMLYSNGQVVGIMRYVTSLKLVDRQVMYSTLVACAVGSILIAIVVISNQYFIRSIVRPIQEIMTLTKRIADGGYGSQIPKEYDDEIGEMVDTINDMSLKLSQSEKIKTEFISSVSHELRTPLTAITGWGETLTYDENITGDSRRGVEIIIREAKRLTTMVEELLEFTRIEDGRFRLNIETVDLVAELEDALFIYGELFRQEHMTLQYAPYGEELPEIQGDPERLKQVFLNILDNAAKYGEEGRKIEVSVKPVYNYQDSGKDYIAVRIRDFGPGVPEDELSSIKLKFYKGSSKKRGSGIGLAVCEEIVNLHDGILEIENAEGGGLAVTVLLPINSN